MKEKVCLSARQGFVPIIILLSVGVIVAIVSSFFVLQKVPTLKQALPATESPKIESKTSQAVTVAKQDLAKRLEVSQNSISVVSQEEVEWPDTSLGCPAEGKSYAQVITPGYKIVLSYQGKTYSYHSALNQKPFLCEKKPTSSISKTEINWDEAVLLIRSCQVKMVSQTHSRAVGLTLKDGTSRSTQEPKIDLVLEEAENASRLCGFPIDMLTE